MARRIALPALLTAAALAVGGCTTSGTGSGSSSTSFKGEQAKVAAAIEDLQSAGSKGDQQRVCSELLARALVDRLSARPGGCQKVVDEALKDTDTSDLSVRSVRISGSTATARVTSDVGSSPDKVANIRLVREGGRWKIASLG